MAKRLVAEEQQMLEVRVKGGGQSVSAVHELKWEVINTRKWYNY